MRDLGARRSSRAPMPESSAISQSRTFKARSAVTGCTDLIRRVCQDPKYASKLPHNTSETVDSLRTGPSLGLPPLCQFTIHDSRFTIYFVTKSIVIGTAGHIDHGKTALVRALTGIDADRLPEEK